MVLNTDFLSRNLSDFCRSVYVARRGQTAEAEAPTLDRLCAEAVWYYSIAVAESFIAEQSDKRCGCGCGNNTKNQALGEAFLRVAELLGGLADTGFEFLIHRAQGRQGKMKLTINGKPCGPLEISHAPLGGLAEAVSPLLGRGSRWSDILPLISDVSGCSLICEGRGFAPPLDPDTAQVLIARLTGAFHMNLTLLMSELKVAHFGRLIEVLMTRGLEEEPASSD